MEASKPAPRKIHLDFIEGMRATAALVVLVNHAYGQIWNEAAHEYPPPVLGILTYSLAVGHLAVSVFIAISGFCLMMPVTRGSGELQGGWLLFFKRRARRILPPYYAALLLSLALIVTIIGKPTGTLWDVCIGIRLTDLISHFVLMQHFFGTGKINYAFWSISLEWQIYFLFPLLVLCFKRFGAPLTVLVALALGYSVPIFVDASHERILRANLHFFGLFALGMAAARVAFAKEERIAKVRGQVPWALVALGLIALMVGLVAHWGWLESQYHWPLLDVFSASTAGALLIAAMQSEKNPVRRVFEVKPLVWVGRFSYSLYLIHAPLMQVFWQYVLRPFGMLGTPGFFLLTFVGMPLILIIAYGFYRLAEAPFIGSRAAAPVATATPPAAG